MHYKSNNILTKTKLVFLAKRYPPHIGGVETHISHLSKELLSQNYDIFVVTEQHDLSLKLHETIDTVHVLRIPKQHTHSKLGIWFWMLWHFPLFLQADIVHAHDVGWWYLPLRVLLWWKPLYTTFHGYEGYTEPKIGAILSRKLIEFLSQKTICIGAWMKQWYKQHPDAISYGAASYTQHALPKNTSAVFIGRLSKDTGILAYIEAAIRMKGAISLDIYGEGSLLPAIQNLIIPYAHIQYKGVTTQGEKVLTNHRFAFVSRYLGMIEAEQVGRLVFAHWDTNIKKSYLDAFPNASNMIMFHDPQDLVLELQYILHHPKQEQVMIKNAQQWAIKQTWQQVATMYKELWRK